MGQEVDGPIDVEETEVRVRVMLPACSAMFARPIEATLQNKGRHPPRRQEQELRGSMRQLPRGGACGISRWSDRPAGFYTAEALAKAYGEQARIDILDRYPVPYGLIRFGVAPDHQSLKAVVQALRQGRRERPGVEFIGNVTRRPRRFGRRTARAI